MSILLRDNIRTHKDRLRQTRRKRFMQLLLLVIIGAAIAAGWYFRPQLMALIERWQG